MADGPEFKIATGFVEVTAKVNKDKVQREADAAMDIVDDAFRRGGERAGESFTRTASGRMRDSRARFTREADAAVSGVEDAVAAAGRRAGDTFTRDITGRLRGNRGHYVRAGTTIGDDTSRGMRSGLLLGVRRFGDDVLGGLRTLGKKGADKLKDDFSKALGSINSISVFTFLMKAAAAAAAFGASLQIIPPTIYAIMGALAAVPALAAAAAASIATIAIGSIGIGSAIGEVFSPPKGGGGGGGGGAADTGARDRVAAAERRLAAAQREAKSAQENLNTARREARRELRDMAVALAGVRLDEKSAALAVAEAERELARVMRDRSADNIDRERAQLALEQAKQTLLETQIRAKDLAEDQARAAAAGVEGSDRVKSALERQQSAADGLIDAQVALKQAHQQAGAAGASGGAAVQRAYDKLTPSAKKFVDVIAKYKNELSGLRTLAQERIFKELDEHLDGFIKRWLPEARKGIKLFGDNWNQTLAQTMDSFSSPKFIGAIDKVLGAADRIWDGFNKRIPDIADMFANLMEGASPFIEEVGDHLLGMLDDFTTWIDENAKDGDLKTFFSEAADQVNALFDAGKEAVTIIGQLVDIAMGDEKDKSKNKKSGLEGMADTLERISDWLDSEKGRETIKGWIDGFKDFAHAIEDAVEWWGDLRDAWNDFEKDRKENQRKVKIWALELQLSFLGAYGRILDGAVLAFGWIPGLGPRLKESQKRFREYKDAVNRELSGLKDQTIKIDIRPNTERLNKVEAQLSRYGIELAKGGIVEAANGLINNANMGAGIFTAPTVLFGERGTARDGGSKEAFVPENIPRPRALGILGEAASWHGARVVPTEAIAGGGTGGGLAGSTVYVAVTMDFPTGPVTQIVRGVITDNPRTVADAAREGDRQRSWVSPQRAGR